MKIPIAIPAGFCFCAAAGYLLAAALRPAPPIRVGAHDLSTAGRQSPVPEAAASLAPSPTLTESQDAAVRMEQWLAGTLAVSARGELNEMVRLATRTLGRRVIMQLDRIPHIPLRNWLQAVALAELANKGGMSFKEFMQDAEFAAISSTCRLEIIRQALGEVAAFSLNGAFRQIEPFASTRQGRILFDTLVEAVPAASAAAVFEALAGSAGMPVTDRASQMVSVIKKWAAMDPDQAWRAAVDEMPPSRAQQRLLMSLMDGQAGKGPSRLRQWIDALPDSPAKKYGMEKLMHASEPPPAQSGP